MGVRSLGNTLASFDYKFASTKKVSSTSTQQRAQTAPSGAVHFLEFGGPYASLNDAVGNGTGGTTSLDLTVNTGKLALNNTTYGGPPGYTDAGFQADSVSYDTALRTAEDVLPNMAGDFTIDCCCFNPHLRSGSSNMAWCVADWNGTGNTMYIYNASGSCRFDTADSNFSSRLNDSSTSGEAGGSINYIRNKWCVSRLRRLNDRMYVEWYVANDELNDWILAPPGNSFNGTVGGTGPNTNNSSGGAMLINSWNNNGGAYTITDFGICWLAFYESSHTDPPWIPE